MAQAAHESTFEVSAEQYFKAVADFEKYPDFVDGMKKVTIKPGETRADGTVESVGHYEFSMMSKDMSYNLNLKHNAGAGSVSWTLKDSEFFKVNNGAWKIEGISSGKCKVHYSLEVEFNFSVPGFILKGIVKGTLPSMMNSFYERAKKL